MAAPITLSDKLMLAPVLARSLLAAVIHLVTRPLQQGPHARTLFKDFLFAALRTALAVIPPPTEQYIIAPTDVHYRSHVRKRQLPPETTILNSGLALHWLGPRSAHKIVVYLHGGGYVFSCGPGHWAWLHDLRDSVARDADVSFVVVSYALAPRGQYPQQLCQAAEALAWLLDDQRRSPADIMIMGDSAGANLAMSLLSHLLHPHPAVPHRIDLQEPLAGVVLISPWVSFDMDDPSFSTNRNSDIIEKSTGHRWSTAFLGPAPRDNYNHPTTAPDAWFRDLSSRVRDVLIWAGGAEVLRDSIDRFAQQMHRAHPRVQYVVEAGAAHEEFILERAFAHESQGEGNETVRAWLAMRL